VGQTYKICLHSIHFVAWVFNQLVSTQLHSDNYGHKLRPSWLIRYKIQKLLITRDATQVRHK